MGNPIQVFIHFLSYSQQHYRDIYLSPFIQLIALIVLKVLIVLIVLNLFSFFYQRYSTITIIPSLALYFNCRSAFPKILKKMDITYGSRIS